MSLYHLNKYMIFHKYFFISDLLTHKLKLFEYPLHLTKILLPFVFNIFSIIYSSLVFFVFESSLS